MDDEAAMADADIAVAAEASEGFSAEGGRFSVHDLEVGQKLTGRVQSIRQYGCFVDVGADKDGLVHISKMTGGFVENIDSLVEPGQEVTVWVAQVMEDGKLSLTMVEELPHSPRMVDLSPFQQVPATQWMPGKVAAFADFGAFVWVWPPVDGAAPAQGLVHITQIRDGFVNHPADELEVGQEVQVRVVNLDVFNSRLGLSMKEPEPVVEQRQVPDVSGFEGVPADEWLTGTVHHTATFGAFVEVAPPGGGSAVQGLVHVTQIKDGFVDDPAAEVDVGQEVQVRVINLDTHAGKLGLSMKPLE